MHRPFQFINLLTISMFLYASAGFAQDEESEAVPAGQEVEVNEDNYRQFMELKDARQQRDMLPENSYQSQAGAQKIDKLPEESQKHLRNELREIIIQGDQWQPGDENTDYPYVPSNAASTNRALQKKEADAWGELVDNYHKREAEIYGNASRSKAASSTAGAAGEGSAGGNMGQGSEGQQASQQSNSKQSSTAGSYSPESSNDPNATSTEGVSQNAMEFLKGQGNQVANAGEANTASPVSNNGQADAQDDGQSDAQASEQASGQADSQAQAEQQSADEQNRTASTSSESTAPPSPDETESDSTEGTSQNALEYLMESSTRTNQEGTLTIEDLLNAQGVRNATGADSQEDPDTTPPDNGGAP